MGNIYWLASYPKSGNTWMRILLANYLWAKDEPLSINNLAGGPIASARQAFDDHVGIEASDLLPEEIERYRPRIYDYLSAKSKGPVFLKVHDAFTHNAEGRPLFSRTATGGVIYLIRNPLDVAVSFAHHNNTAIGRIVERMADPKQTFINNPNRIELQLTQRLLTWSGHVTSWVTDSKLPVLVVRYEDTKADPLESFRRVVEFCGLETDPVRIAKAVDFARFDRLQAQETKTGFRERMPNAKRFFRRGLTGAWRDEIPPHLVKKLVSDHQDVMQRFGYLTADGEIVY